MIRDDARVPPVEACGLERVASTLVSVHFDGRIDGFSLQPWREAGTASRSALGAGRRARPSWRPSVRN